MCSELSDFSDNLTLLDTDLDQLNVKDPDTLYFRIENYLQELIDTYAIYQPNCRDIIKLRTLLDEVYLLHEDCSLDVREDMNDI